MVLSLIDDAVAAGARQHRACAVIGLPPRTVQRWRRQGDGGDRRCGPGRPPPNRLSEAERKRIIKTANSKEHRGLSPKQIVPRLADKGVYLASESTFYRVLHQEGQMTHRQASRPARHRRPREHQATGPCQVWSWDITYLRGEVRGRFYYLYLFEDIWSRKIVGWRVEGRESTDLASELFAHICAEQGVAHESLILHSDNGGPMKGSTMLATLQRLGVVPSFSRPRVSDDNPYSEALFRTLKYRPAFPRRPFTSLDEARGWVSDFVAWYNTEHLHSAIRYVTPNDRHSGRDEVILAKRRLVYQRAKAHRLERWSGDIRDWTPVDTVTLNPERCNTEARS